MQRIIIKMAVFMFSCLLILTSAINWTVRHYIEELRFAKETDNLFWQMEQIIDANDREMGSIVEEFSNLCLAKAETAAYIVEQDPDLYTDMEALYKVADLLDVDEIHLFDAQGVIYAGTHPEYYGYSFDSGDQMAFFQPMLEDTSLSLCQDILPNTAEGKPMQYAAVWNESGTKIVQIGVTPSRVLQAQAGNTITKVFEMMPAELGQIYLAIDWETDEVVGSTQLELVGMTASELEIPAQAILDIHTNGADVQGEYRWNGVDYLYRLHRIDDLIVMKLYDQGLIFQTVGTDSVLTAIYIIIFSILATICVAIYLNRKIIRSIFVINRKLELIEQGDLDVTFVQDSVPEIKALSDHINAMVKSLINQAHKLSIALDLAKIPTGIIEYNSTTKKVTATSKVKDILKMSQAEYQEAFTNGECAKQKLHEIILESNMVEEHIYKLRDGEHYIKLEQFQDFEDTLVLVMDITREVMEKEFIKHQRDTDVLTGRYNRRAFYEKMETIIQRVNTEDMGLCIIDVDNLKPINDKYGHETGDFYIQSIANLLDFEGDYITGRLGGDEFAALLYNAKAKELEARFQGLLSKRDVQSIWLEDGTAIPLAFSMGYALSPEDGTDYHCLLKLSDQRMYEDKCQRKGGAEYVRGNRR